MEISILLTLIFIGIILGRTIFQAGKGHLIEEEQINDSATIKYNLPNTLSPRAVKLVLKELYLLNIVTSTNNQKTTQTTPIQLQNHKLEG